MGILQKPKLAKPICGITFASDIVLSAVISEMEKILGSIEDQTLPFDFSSFTDYYREEMGTELKKIFLSFVDLVDPGSLASIKIKTNKIEELWAIEGKRKINLDPGYINSAKLVLASTKDFSHRIYIGEGIYGDVQLRFWKGQFRASEWTYPDYKTDTALDFFHRVREKYKKQVKKYEQKNKL